MEHGLIRNPKTERRHFLSIDKGGWVALVAGLLLAFLPFFFNQLRWIMSYLKILVHELGHSVVAWSFGYPGVPTFNLQHGGGVARHGDQAMWLLALVALAFVLFVINNLSNPAALLAAAVFLSAYLGAILTDVHKMLELYMGHGTELLIAAIFIYRAASNWAVHHALERILYGGAGFYLIYENVLFSYLLLVDKAYRQEYFDGIAPGLLNDFYRIWVEHLKTTRFETLTIFHLLVTLVCPLVAIGLHCLLQYRVGRET